MRQDCLRDNKQRRMNVVLPLLRVIYTRKNTVRKYIFDGRNFAKFYSGTDFVTDVTRNKKRGIISRRNKISYYVTRVSNNYKNC